MVLFFSYCDHQVAFSHHNTYCLRVFFIYLFIYLFMYVCMYLFIYFNLWNDIENADWFITVREGQGEF